jgi:hypothetical protein
MLLENVVVYKSFHSQLFDLFLSTPRRQVLPYRLFFTGIIRPVKKYLRGSTCRLAIQSAKSAAK